MGKRGLTVKYLSAMADSKLVFQESKRESGIRFEPPEQKTYVPTVKERWETLTAPGRTQTTLLFAVLSLGLLMMVSGLLREGLGGPKVIDDVHVVEVVVKGEVRPSPDRETCRVKVVFPEVPLTLEFEGEKVVTAAGDLSLECSFHTRRPPGFCELVLEQEGLSPLKASDLRLTGTPLEARVSGFDWKREKS